MTGQQERTEQLLDHVVYLTERRRELEDRIGKVLAERDQAYGALRANSGKSVPELAQLLRDRLIAAGWTDEQIKGAGVGYHSILRAGSQT